MNAPTEAQAAILKALNDFGMSVSSRQASCHDLARYPDVQALGLDAQAVEAAIAAGKGEGLFMVKAKGMGQVVVPAYKGAEYTRAQNWTPTGFYDPKPTPRPEPEPTTTPAAPAAQGYRQGDERFMTAVSKAPIVGTMFPIGDTLHVCTAHSQNGGWYLSQRMIDDEDLFEFEGVLVTYVYHRPATAEEVREFEAAQANVVDVTPEESVALAPVTAQELREYVNLHGRVSRTGRPQGEPLAFFPGFNRSGDFTLLRTPEGVALYYRNVFADTHETLSVAAEALPDRLRLGLSLLPALTPAADDDLDTL